MLGKVVSVTDARVVATEKPRARLFSVEIEFWGEDGVAPIRVGEIVDITARAMSKLPRCAKCPATGVYLCAACMNGGVSDCDKASFCKTHLEPHSEHGS